MCLFDDEGNKKTDRGKCICSDSSGYNSHSKVATGELISDGGAVRGPPCKGGAGHRAWLLV
jgi:hypothetical protein